MRAGESPDGALSGHAQRGGQLPPHDADAGAPRAVELRGHTTSSSSSRARERGDGATGAGAVAHQV
eukprot:gene37275-47802_t